MPAERQVIGVAIALALSREALHHREQVLRQQQRLAFHVATGRVKRWEVPWLPDTQDLLRRARELVVDAGVLNRQFAKLPATNDG